MTNYIFFKRNVIKNCIPPTVYVDQYIMFVNKGIIRKAWFQGLHTDTH